MAPREKYKSSYTEQDLLDAVSEAKAKLLTTRVAARKYGVSPDHCYGPPKRKVFFKNLQA